MGDVDKREREGQHHITKGKRRRGGGTVRGSVISTSTYSYFNCVYVVVSLRSNPPSPPPSATMTYS